MKKRALSGLLKLDGPLLSMLSLLIAIVISGVIMAVCGYNPIEAFGAILAGSFGSQRAIVQTLTQATPLIITGLTFAFAKKASLINLGAEGQLYMGALASAAVGMLDLGLPMALHLPLAVAVGMAVGGLYACLVFVFNFKFCSNEVIATVMLNSIATYLVDYLLNGPMLAENSSVAQTERVLETAQLPRIFQQYQLTIAILLAVAACILVKLPAQPVLDIPTVEILLVADAKPVQPEQEDMALELRTADPVPAMPMQPASPEPAKAVPAEPGPSPNAAAAVQPEPEKPAPQPVPQPVAAPQKQPKAKNAPETLLPQEELEQREMRSEERRVGKECRSRWSPYH